MTDTTTAFADLQHQLGATPPHALSQLADDDLRDLAGAVHEARRRQARELAAAGDAAFELVPRLLRGPIKKLLR